MIDTSYWDQHFEEPDEDDLAREIEAYLAARAGGNAERADELDRLLREADEAIAEADILIAVISWVESHIGDGPPAVAWGEPPV